MSIIDLTRFTQPKEEIIPIVNGWGVSTNHRKIWEPRKEDGWYLVRFGEDITVVRLATPLEVLKTLNDKNFLRVYPLGTEGIPMNFDNFIKRGFGETIPVNFLNQSIFTIAKVVLWEDNRFYYFEEDSKTQRSLLNQARGAFESEQPITNIKEVTPEIRYLFLILSLQRQSYREVQELERLRLSQAEKEKRIKEFQNTFAGRLQKTVEDAGGKLVRFHKSGRGWMVTWKIGEQVVKSTIRDNFSIINAGFCLSGDDKSHSMASLVMLAKMFQTEEGSLYLTRE